MVEFEYDSPIRHVQVIYTDHVQCGTNVTFSKDLAAILGFKANHQYWQYDSDDCTTAGEKPMLMTT